MQGWAGHKHLFIIFQQRNALQKLNIFSTTTTTTLFIPLYIHYEKRNKKILSSSPLPPFSPLPPPPFPPRSCPAPRRIRIRARTQPLPAGPTRPAPSCRQPLLRSWFDPSNSAPPCAASRARTRGCISFSRPRFGPAGPFSARFRGPFGLSFPDLFRLPWKRIGAVKGTKIPIFSCCCLLRDTFFFPKLAGSRVDSDS